MELSILPSRVKRPCAHPGCRELVEHGRCDKHKKQDQKQRDEQRGSAHERGYTSRWSKYSKWFLRQPENVFCKLQLPGCKNISECVDHIQPVNGADDPLFFEPINHQSACIHCNSVKGHRYVKGEGKPFGG
jgi:5-methylcytosine-specific restriction enzyme A